MDGRTRTWLTLLAAGAALALGLPVAHAAGPAHASVVRTSSGLTCTVVGTGGADVIIGTSGADVICGLGGNDVIKGLGGNDVIDGGAGADTISGGTGNDTVSAGTGNDTIAGGDGSDHGSGDTGNDTVSGGAGTDRLDGGVGADQVDGGSGADSVAGGTGDDHVAGSTGDDHVSGGAGDDVVTGGDGSDILSGGSGADSANGGAGDDTCTFDEADISFVSCVYDTKAPVIGALVLDQTSVDVTDAAAAVGFTVHIRDDSQVAYVNVGANDSYGSFISDWDATLVSGTAHDGVWGGTLTIARWAAEGQDPIEVLAGDRVGRSSSVKPAGTLTVVDANADTALPQLVTASVAPHTGSFPLDSAAGDQVVDVTAHLTDDGSGVSAPSACLVVPIGAADATMPCTQMSLTSGTTLDGDWSAAVTLSAGSAAGDWGLLVRVSDVAHVGRGSRTS